jgi:hypothetical protein
MTQHFLGYNTMKIIPHPSYSQDLASSDFQFFGHVKQILAGNEFPDGGGIYWSGQCDFGEY